MAITGPRTLDTTTLALGLAQIRIGTSSTYIGNSQPALSSTDSIGSLETTTFNAGQEFYKHMSGYPQLEDAIFPLSETASIEIAFHEITPANIALTKGLDPTAYSSAHTGEIALGNLSTPAYLRMEAAYTYPDGVNTMTIIFPRAQAEASPAVEFAKEEPAAPTVNLEGKRADSGTSGGHSVWNAAPLGKIIWDDGSGTTTTTSTTTTTTTA